MRWPSDLERAGARAGEGDWETEEWKVPLLAAAEEPWPRDTIADGGNCSTKMMCAPHADLELMHLLGARIPVAMAMTSVAGKGVSPSPLWP